MTVMALSHATSFTCLNSKQYFMMLLETTIYMLTMLMSRDVQRILFAFDCESSYHNADESNTVHLFMILFVQIL